MVGSTSSFSNMHGFIYNNNDHYRSMVMDAMRINQDYASKCLIIDEELNTDAIMFFLTFEIFQRTIMGWVHKSE